MRPSTSARNFAYMTIDILEVHALAAPVPVIQAQNLHIEVPETLFPRINMSRVGNGDTEMLLQGCNAIGSPVHGTKVG